MAELQRGGRHWPAAAFCLAGAVHRASALPFCVAGAVHRAFWRSCGAVARGCLLPGRRSTQSLRTSLLRGRRSIHRASWRSCGAVAAAGPRLPFAWQPAVHRHRALRGRGNTQSSTEWSSSQLLTAPLLTGPLLITTHHNLSHPNSSQFHFSHLTSHTSPKFTFKSHIHKGLTCGVIRSFYFFLGRPGGLPETN